MSAKWLFTFKHFKFPLLPLLTHSAMICHTSYLLTYGPMVLWTISTDYVLFVICDFLYIAICAHFYTKDTLQTTFGHLKAVFGHLKVVAWPLLRIKTRLFQILRLKIP